MALVAPTLTAPPSTPAVTDSDIRDWLNVTSVEPGMSEAVTGALAYVEKRCGPILGGAVSERTTCNPGAQLVLNNTNVERLDSLIDPYGNERVGDMDSDDVLWREGVVLTPTPLMGTWVVTYTVAADPGRTALLRVAAQVIARQLWAVRKPGTRGGGFGPGPGDLPIGFAIPRAASDIMDRYAPPAFG